MSLEDKAKAAAKKIEGIIQEGAGDLAGDREVEAKGREKKIEGKAREGSVKVQDDVKGKVN